MTHPANATPPTAVEPKTCYEVLGVTYYASADEVRRGWENALQKLEHETMLRLAGAPPDGQAATERGAITHAFMTLNDPLRRREYNAWLASQTNPGRDQTESQEPLDRVAGTGAVSSMATRSAVHVVSDDKSHSVRANALIPETPNFGPAPTKEAPIDLRAGLGERQARAEDARSETYYGAGDYAPLGVRFAAMVVDGVLLCFIGAVVLSVSAAVSRRNVADGDASFLAAFGVGSVLLLLVTGALYYAFGESGKHRATLGKWWLGIEVVRSDGETRVGFLRALIRYVLRHFDATVVMLGYLMTFVSERKQTLHDRLSDCVVLTARAPPRRWPLLVVGVFAGFVLVTSIVLPRLLSGSRSEVAGPAKLAPSDERFDPTSAGPRRDEVGLAYSTAMSLRNSLSEYFTTNGRWPAPDALGQLIERSSRPASLQAHEAKLYPEGVFSVSLGATPQGTARLVFTPLPSTSPVEWGCTPINIALASMIEKCRGE